MKLLIVDRDGVLNHDSPDYIKSPDEWCPIPGSLEAVARLNRAGWRVVVATNQSGLHRGLFDVEALSAIHSELQRRVAAAGGHLEAIFFCPCLPEEGCACYKPAPGMLREIAARLHVSLETVPFVGDSLRDLEAAAAAGALPVLVRTGNGMRTLQQDASALPAGTRVYDDLAGAADALIAR